MYVCTYILFVPIIGVVQELRVIIYVFIRCPTADLIIFFNSHPGSNISTKVEIFAPRIKYSHPGLNIRTPV